MAAGHDGAEVVVLVRGLRHLALAGGDVEEGARVELDCAVALLGQQGRQRAAVSGVGDVQARLLPLHVGHAARLGVRADVGQLVHAVVSDGAKENQLEVNVTQVGRAVRITDVVRAVQLRDFFFGGGGIF